VTTTSGGLDVSALRGSFAGHLVTGADADYDAVRAACVWNGDIDRRPAVIAQATSPDDVAAALALARANGREVSVRGGGHNFSGSCIADDAVMIDLGPMSDVRVDPAAKRAWCGGGARWAQLDAATQAHGLATPGGFISHTGVAGLTLGGGIGWLTPRAGLSSDNLVSAEVVLADGRTVRASSTEHPDLFWALRGGGGNFGVVTEFEFALIEEGPLVQLALSFWGLDDGAEAWRVARDLVGELPDDVSLFMAALNAPPAPFVPEPDQGAPGYAVLLVDHGSPSAFGRAVASLRGAVEPAFVFDTPMPYVALQQMFDTAAPWGIRGYEKALSFEQLPDAVIDEVAKSLPAKSSPMSFLPMFVLRGAFGRHADDDSAFGGSRRTGFVLNLAAIAPTAELLAADRDWVRELWSALVPHAVGVGSYVNFMTELEPDRVEASYGREKYERLRRVKATYDPGNVFHLNPNIRPARS
jgi:FAD/FMN-containing dehydrogenase